MDVVLEFERPVVELRKRISQLKGLQDTDGVDLSASIAQLEVQAARLEERIFGGLTPWQRTMLARHPSRPYCLDYVDRLFFEWTELHGDRAGHDDHAMVCGLARVRPTGEEDDPTANLPIAVIGHQKGRNTKQNLFRNFGMARPDGYRKALRIMKLAEHFGLPIVTFIDTPGAYPGIDAEARGQAEAIARNILEMARLTVPVVAIVVGEGGSGGALAIGVANKVIMLENSVYSVISPEGCAAILWRDRAEGPRAAEALRITAADCMELGVTDTVVPEPPGGAHRDPGFAIDAVGRVIRAGLAELLTLDAAALTAHRYDRFREMGRLVDPDAP
ncbi:MAG: acetyl-CoA carboxylase carboxyl transferase subunit alpha [Myxococcota bacterium]